MYAVYKRLASGDFGVETVIPFMLLRMDGIIQFILGVSLNFVLEESALTNATRPVLVVFAQIPRQKPLDCRGVTDQNLEDDARSRSTRSTLGQINNRPALVCGTAYPRSVAIVRSLP